MAATPPVYLILSDLIIVKIYAEQYKLSSPLCVSSIVL
jgi:hypothetical protein